MIALVIFCLVLVAGGGPDHQATGFKYWKDPGAFKAYKAGKLI